MSTARPKPMDTFIQWRKSLKKRPSFSFHSSVKLRHTSGMVRVKKRLVVSIAVVPKWGHRVKFSPPRNLIQPPRWCWDLYGVWFICDWTDCQQHVLLNSPVIKGYLIIDLFVCAFYSKIVFQLYFIVPFWPSIKQKFGHSCFIRSKRIHRLSSAYKRFTNN